MLSDLEWKFIYKILKDQLLLNRLIIDILIVESKYHIILNDRSY